MIDAPSLASTPAPAPTPCVEPGSAPTRRSRLAAIPSPPSPRPVLARRLLGSQRLSRLLLWLLRTLPTLPADDALNALPVEQRGSRREGTLPSRRLGRRATPGRSARSEPAHRGLA